MFARVTFNFFFFLFFNWGRSFPSDNFIEESVYFILCSSYTFLNMDVFWYWLRYLWTAAAVTRSLPSSSSLYFSYFAIPRCKWICSVFDWYSSRCLFFSFFDWNLLYSILPLYSFVQLLKFLKSKLLHTLQLIQENYFKVTFVNHIASLVRPHSLLKFRRINEMRLSH